MRVVAEHPVKRVYRLFGIEVFSIEYEGLDEELFISNVDGNFEIAATEDEGDWEEEDSDFGFRA